MILFNIRILLKRFDRNPEASFFETNLDFFDLQTSQIDRTKYLLFLVINPFEFISLVFLTFQTISIHYI